MDFSFTEEEIMIRDMARDFAQKEIAPNVAEYDREERYPIEIVRKMASLGMLGSIFPPEYGGSNMSHMGLALMVEALSNTCQMMGSAAGQSCALQAAGLFYYGTDEQKKRFLLPFSKAERLGGAGVTEPHSGTDVAAMETMYEDKGDHFVLNGAKTWIGGAGHADWFITFATKDKALKHKGISAFVVERDSPGFTTRRFHNKVGYRPATTGELIFDNCIVPKANLVGEQGEGFKVAMASVENGRMVVSSRAIGVISACLKECVEYAKGRIVFEQPIGRFQLVQSKITDMVVGLESAQFLNYRLAWLRDKGVTSARKEAAIAKMYATDVLMRTVVDACQIFGAYSCSDEYNVGRYYRDAKFFQIVEGNNDLQRVLIAEITLGYRR